jgi:tetratricopeptide (TPR) repeat protein
MQTALSSWPNEPRWQAYAAQLSIINGQLDDAINHLENAISVEPDHLPHYLALGDAHLKSGQTELGIRTLEKAVQTTPDHFDVYLALATAQLINEDYSQAVKNAEKAITLAPEQLSPLLLRSEIALKMDDPHQANAHVEAALRINADHSGALFLKAKAVDLLGDTEESMNIVEKAIPLSNNPLPFLLHRAHLRSSLEGSQGYLAELQEICSKYPDEPLVLAPLAETLAKTDHPEESIQVAQQALRHSNGHLPIDEQARLHQLLGILLRESGQLDQAIYQLSEAIQIAPNRLEAYLELGLTHEERRQHGSALDVYKRAIGINPTNPRPYIQAGLLLKSSRDYPAAESMLRRAAELAPEDITIHRQLAALVALNLVHNRQPVSSDI